MNRIELLIKEKGFNMTSFAEKMNTTFFYVTYLNFTTVTPSPPS